MLTRERLLDAMALDAVIDEGERGLAEAGLTLELKKRISSDPEVRQRALERLIGLAETVNLLPNTFFAKPAAARTKELKHLFDDTSATDALFASSLTQGSYPAIMQRLAKLAENFGRYELITVQTAIAVTNETKEKIMKQLKEKDTYQIVWFAAVPSLLRGARLLRKNRLIDQSARGKLSSLLHSI